MNLPEFGQLPFEGAKERAMPDASLRVDASQAVAIAISRVGEASVLCPFFSACDGVLVIDRGQGTRAFYENGGQTGYEMCDIVARTGARRLVLGFVGGAEAAELRNKGVDIRLGSCACGLDELVDCFDDLPTA